MSHRKPEPRPTPRADALETTDGILTFARIDGHTLHRDRGGRVILTPPGDDRAGSILEPDAVARLHHALACALHPYGTKPITDEQTETAREHLSRVHGVNLPAKIIRATLEAVQGA
jgi:hypothetical protein